MFIYTKQKVRKRRQIAIVGADAVVETVVGASVWASVEVVSCVELVVERGAVEVVMVEAMVDGSVIMVTFNNVQSVVLVGLYLFFYLLTFETGKL